MYTSRRLIKIGDRKEILMFDNETEPQTIDDEKRLTKWKMPSEKMAGGTQFGHCNFGEWCKFMCEKLSKAKRIISIKINERGEVALFEEIRSTG